jgi:hypothetical protein
MGSTVDPSGVNGANGWTVESLWDGQVPPDTELQPHQWALLYDSSCKSSCSNEYEGLCIRSEVFDVILCIITQWLSIFQRILPPHLG